MNLIQIQEHLKDLPTQAIMAYANGQNPQVPPYMALGEMNRRKNMEQRAAQAPDSSVKEKLESELSQQTALPGIGQGMNMRMNPEGMPEPMPAAQPQMAPQMPKMQNPPMAQKTPPQQLSQPGSIPAGAPGMAGGGLAGLPVDPDMFSYAPGGIVAFANPENEQVVPEASAAPEGDQGLPVALANQILRDQLMGKSNLPMPVDRDKVRAEEIAKNPQLAGILNKLPGEALAKLATELESQNTAQRSRFQEGEGRQGLAALSNALIAAGEATRGQRGFGGIGAAFGGFGKAYNASTAEAEQRAARQQAMERAQTIETMKLQSDIEQMQRAFAEGNIDKAMKLKEQINAREAKIEEMKGTGAKEVLNQADKKAQRDAQAARYKTQEAHEQRMYEQAKRAADISAATKPTADEKLAARIRDDVNADKAYQTLAKKLEGVELYSDDYYQILDAMREIAITHYPTDGKVKPPPAVKRKENSTKPQEQGFWDKFLYGPKPTSPKNPTEVPLPPGFKKVQ